MPFLPATHFGMSALSRLLLGGLLHFMLAPGPAAGATLTWTGGVSQFTEIGGNWSPIQVPAASDDLVWTGSGALFCQFGPTAVQSSRSWTVTGDKQIHTSRAHTIAQDIRLSGAGALRISCIDSIVVGGDIEHAGSGSVIIQSGCPVVGADSARFNGFLVVAGLNSRLLAGDVLIGRSLSVSAKARLVASQSLALIPGAHIVLDDAASSITAPDLAVPFNSYVSLSAGRLALAGELMLEGALIAALGARVDATTVRLAGNGAVSGSGTLVAPLVIEGGATLILAENGKLTVGDPANPSGVTLAGTVTVQSTGELECRSAAAVALPASVNLNGGTLRSASGFTLGDGAYMQARGTVAGDLNVTGGELSVQSATPKQLTIVGNWSQGAAARRTVYLTESGGGWESDSMVVTGQADPGGTLDIWYDDQAGTPSTAIPFLFYASRPTAGEFDEVLLNGMPVTTELAIVYHTNRAEIVFSGTVSVGPGRHPEALALSARSGPVHSLHLSLPDEADVKLRLYDVGGREAWRVHSGALAAGAHRFDLPDRSLASGVYFARAEVRMEGRVAESRVARVVVRN